MVDPLQEQFMAVSPYAFTLNNPVNWVDPDGRFTLKGEAAREYVEGLQQIWQDDEKEKKSKQSYTDYQFNINNLFENKKFNLGDYYLSETSLGLGIIGEAMIAKGAQHSNALFQQGMRRGVTGNYLLAGRNLSLFGQNPMTTSTAPKTAFGVAGRFAASTGYLLGGVNLAYDTYLYSQGNITGLRYSYRTGSFAASIVTGLTFGGPWGVAVAAGLYTGEVAYDTSVEVKQEVFGVKFNQFYRTLKGGWLNR